jgi:hypothetical protein
MRHAHLLGVFDVPLLELLHEAPELRLVQLAELVDVGKAALQQRRAAKSLTLGLGDRD